MLVERLGYVVETLHLHSFAFSVYQRAGALNIRTYLRNRAFREAPDGLAIPPAWMLMAVAGSAEAGVFLDGGRKAADSIRDILRRNGTGMEDLGAILDFGCGCGRVLRFWKELRQTEIHGTEYNAGLAQWCRNNIPFVHAGSNELMPPAGYPGATFDLIYALSVFTHLPEHAQMAWMTEFRRILRPGGLLLLSLHGAHYLPRLNKAERRSFLDGHAVTRHSRSAGMNLCCAFHPEDWVRKNLAVDFEVVDFVPEGALGNPRQDLWLFRRKPGALPRTGLPLH